MKENKLKQNIKKLNEKRELVKKKIDLRKRVDNQL